MPVKAVLFDLDNTLYEYEKCNNAGLDAVFTSLSLMFNKPKETVKEIFHDSREQVKMRLKNTASSHSRFLYFQKTIESLKGTTDIELTQRIHNLYWDAYLNQMKLYVGVIDFFKQLKDAGIKIVIASNLTTEIQFKKLIHLSIDKYIDFVVTSEEAGQDKPGEPVFLLALEKLGLPKEEIVLIGDEPGADIQGAKTFGIKCILVNNGNFKDVIESFKNLNSL